MHLTEEQIVELEAKESDSSNKYFAARHPSMDTHHNRRTFRAGFERGYKLAIPDIIDTPDPDLPSLVDGPKKKCIIEIEVPEDFEKRLDMQWIVEREIDADRWSWRWPAEDNCESCVNAQIGRVFKNNIAK